MITPPRSKRVHKSGRLIRRLRSDGGFGLMEAVIALGIIFGLILILMRTFDSTGRVLVETRRQSAANALAIELIERAQALEWGNMGLAVSTNGATCPDEVGCYTTEFPTLSATAGGWEWGTPAEDVVFATGDTFRPFLDFSETLDRDGTDFTRFIFITAVDDDGDGVEDFRRLTAIVRWIPPDGFRREVVQTTLVAPFTEPAQPLIRTDVTWNGGTLDILARDHELTYLGADLGDAADDVTIPLSVADGAVTPGRDDMRLAVTMPRLEATAITDYISSATIRGESTSIASLKYAGADGLFGTADDPAQVSVDPYSFSMLADNDTLSVGAPESAGPTTWTGQSVVLKDPTGLVVADVSSGETLTSIAGDEVTNVSATGEVDALHDDFPADGIDEALPWATGSFSGADQTVVGQLYGLGGERFAFYRRTGALEVSATADRDDDPLTDARDTFGGLSFLIRNDIRLLDDTVMAKANNLFRGWVVIDPPSGDSMGVKKPMTVTAVGAGESGAFTTLIGGTENELEVWIWNAENGNYDMVGTVDFTAAAPGCDDPVASSAGDVQQVSVPFVSGGFEELRYTVKITVDVRGFCEETTTDSFGNRSYTVWQTGGPMVSGDIDYVVEGVTDPTGTPGYTTLFDLNLGFSTDQFIITSAYLDPDAG